MPTPFLDDLGSDFEARRVVGVAFEMARVALGLADHPDLANEAIAKRMIELVKAGERNPDLLCEGVLKEFREQGLQQQSK
jgi:hypothetical protein